MGLPIPMMFLAEDDEGVFEIVDGTQRIQTLVKFTSDELVLEGLKKLDTLNGFRFRDLPDDQMKHVVDYVDSGRPIVGLRTATHAFNGGGNYARYSNGSNAEGWKGGFGKQVLGEQWVNHHGQHGKEGTRGIVVAGQERNSILRGIEPGSVFGPTDVYTVVIDDLAKSSSPLLLGEVTETLEPTSKGVVGKKNEPMMPVAWTKLYKSPSGKEARVFCTTMGAATDMEAEGTRRLLVNAVYWTLGLEDKIPAKSNVDLVGEFKPTRFGFNGFVKGKKPIDYWTRIPVEQKSPSIPNPDSSLVVHAPPLTPTSQFQPQLQCPPCACVFERRYGIGQQFRRVHQRCYSGVLFLHRRPCR